ncbi:glycosyltransferase family 9 protein [Streptoalloteichus hindustanus]|nr:glycosyltransferase family 9 protein [Streptoalloteichus hindustanus]SHF86118.1 heptosyltransferase-2/glycosyl transferase protein BlmE [Streptoalloteichus hindustanus]
MTDNPAIRRIAVFARLRGPGLGDLVQRNILLSLLRRAHPLAEVSVVAGSELVDRFSELLTGHSYATDVLRCPAVGDTDPGRWREFRRVLAERGFQMCVVDPDSRDLDAREARAAGIPVRVALPTGGPGDTAITHPIRLPPSLRGRPDLYDYARGAAAALGLPAPRSGEVVPVLPKRPEWTPELDAPAPRIAVHPGGARLWNRRWPLRHFARLCVRLVDELDASLYLLGAEQERAELAVLSRDVLAQRPDARVHVAVGESLNRTANLLAGVELLVGNDSAPAHLAAALRTPTVVLYGPTGTEFLWARVYPRHRGVSLRYPCQDIRHAAEDVATRRCEHACPVAYESPEGPYPRCLTDLPVDEVWRAVTRQLPATSARPNGSPR